MLFRRCGKRDIVVKYIDNSVEEAFSDFLNIGNNINLVEPLRDFNGFSWNIITKDIGNLNYNIMYQNISYILGYDFLDKWINNYDPLVDYMGLFQDKIEEQYGKRIRKKFFYSLVRLAVIIRASQDEKYRKIIINKREKIEKQYFEFENREMYLIKISKSKKKREKEIKELDKIINDKKLLQEEYDARNENLPLEKKIFSSRVLKQILKEERKELLRQINEFNEIMKPRVFLEKKSQIEQLLIFFNINEEMNLQEEIEKELIVLQKEVIKCMKINAQKAESKEKIIDLMYRYRYYSFLPIDNKRSIKDLTEIKKDLDELSKEIINKAIELKAIIKIVQNDEVNSNITKKLILSKIISLEDIILKVYQENGNIMLQIFDEEIEDSMMLLENTEKEDIKIKLNKKVKLFM